jgi:hypothetical protein
MLTKFTFGRLPAVPCLLVFLLCSCSFSRVLITSADESLEPKLSELKPGEKYLFYTNQNLIYKLELKEVGKDALHGNMKILNARGQTIGKCEECTLTFEELLAKTTKIKVYIYSSGATAALVTTTTLIGLFIIMATTWTFGGPTLIF